MSLRSDKQAITYRAKVIGGIPKSWGLPMLQNVTLSNGCFPGLLTSSLWICKAVVGTKPRTAYCAFRTLGFTFSKK